ncbi:MAG: hypothetical protein L3J65_10710 [Robiginitomaculum sp.]|nr:hypothetical protein [Robiginitomaculum sp.]
MRFEANSLSDKQEAYSLRFVGNDGLVYTVENALKSHSNFDVTDELKHPFIEPIANEGYAFLAVAFALFILIGVYGKPDFEAPIRGIPLALIAFAVASALVLKFGGVRFLLRRINDKFPDPISLNGLALGYAVTLGFLLLVFL